MATNIATVNLGKKQRYSQMSKLLYMTDGYNIPKMYDGTTLVNWGITPPSTATTATVSSTGNTLVDNCELLWTPVSTTVDSCEIPWSLFSGVTGCMVAGSIDKMVGTTSSLTLLGYTAEPLNAYTALMIHCDGTHGGTTFTDVSQYAHVVTAAGGAITSTTSPKFGTASLYLATDSTDNISVPDHPIWDSGYSDITIDFWYKPLTWDGGQRRIVQIGNNATDFYIGNTSSTSLTAFGAGCNFSVNPGFSAGVWYHVRFCRASNIGYFYIDGIFKGANTCDGNWTGGTTGVRFGLTGSHGIVGYLDELRIDIGIALSVQEFTRPSGPYGSYAAPTNDLIGFTGIISYHNLTPMDLSGYYGVQFWIKSLRTTQVDDYSVILCDSSGAVTELERFNIPVIQAATWTQLTFQFSNPAALTSVASIALCSNRDVGQNAIWIDDVQSIRCKVSLDSTPENVTYGSYSVKFEIPGNVPASTLVAYKAITSADMHLDTQISMSIKCDKDLGYQSLQYLLDNTAACASPLESLYITADLVGDTWTNISLPLAAAAGDTAIISEGLKVIDSKIAPCTIWLDNINRSTAVGGNLTGRYYVWVSYYDSKYDRESDLSPISSVITCAGSAISLTSIPISSDSQINARKIYRSAAGGTVPYLDSTINDNTTTTLSLTKSDASILAATRHPSLAAGAGKFQAPPAAPYLVQFKNRFLMAGSYQYNRGTVTTAASATFTFTTAQLDDSFIGRYIQIIGDTTNYLIQSVNAIAGTCVARPIDDLVSGVYRGTPGAGKSYYITSESDNMIFTSYVDDDDVPRPHGFPIEYVQEITEGIATDKISGLGLVGDSVIATKLYSTHILEGDYPPWATSRISASIGCASHDTICQDEVGNALWLAGEQGIAYCNGSQVSIVSGKIQDIFSSGVTLSLASTMYSSAHAVYDTKNKLYYLFCAAYGSTTNDVCIVLDKSSEDVNQWAWYYFTGIDAASSSIVYDANGIGTIYIGDYDGFQYQLNVGWYDGVVAGSTLSGTATSAAASTLNDTGATFYTTGSGLRNIPLLIYKVSTGETWVYKISSNTGTQLTITGSFTEVPSTSDYKYYIGGYQIDWKSKQFELMRPTDKKLLMDGILNNYKLSTSQKVRIQLLRDLAATSSIANQLRDLSEGEEQVLLVRERVSQAQWEISGFVHGQNIQIVSLGLRLKARGVR